MNGLTLTEIHDLAGQLPLRVYSNKLGIPSLNLTETTYTILVSELQQLEGIRTR
jgi:hypothetical protein